MKIEKLFLQERETLLAHIITIKFFCQQLIHHYPKDNKEHWTTKVLLALILEVERKVTISINRGAYKGSIAVTDAQGFALYAYYHNLPIQEKEYYQWQLRQKIIDQLIKQML